MRCRLFLYCTRSGLQYVAQLLDKNMASKEQEKASDKQKQARLGDKIQAVEGAGLRWLSRKIPIDVHSPELGWSCSSNIAATANLQAWRDAAVAVRAQAHGPTRHFLISHHDSRLVVESFEARMCEGRVLMLARKDGDVGSSPCLCHQCNSTTLVSLF